MKTFYATCKLDGPNNEFLHFKITSDKLESASNVVSVYLKGRFEASGLGGDITHISTRPTRGVEYREL